MKAAKNKNLVQGISNFLNKVNLPDLSSLNRITRMGSLSSGRMLLIAAAVTWSAMTSNIAEGSMAQMARMGIMIGEAGVLSQTMNITRLGGIPYKNGMGQIVISGSAAEEDFWLASNQPQAQIVYNLARASEPAITMDMLEIADSLGTSMEGLEHAVKTASSIRSKIARKTDKAIQQGAVPKTDMEYVHETGDLIRYTQIVPHQNMVAMTKKTMELLGEKGYTVEKMDNKYLDKEGRYKAIHLDLLSKAGQRVELQIHSPETLEANRVTHAMYEEWRNPDTIASRKAELFQKIKAVYDVLPDPDDIQSLANYSRNKV